LHTIPAEQQRSNAPLARRRLRACVRRPGPAGRQGRRRRVPPYLRSHGFSLRLNGSRQRRPRQPVFADTKDGYHPTEERLIMTMLSAHLTQIVCTTFDARLLAASCHAELIVTRGPPASMRSRSAAPDRGAGGGCPSIGFVKGTASRTGFDNERSKICANMRPSDQTGNPALDRHPGRAQHRQVCRRHSPRRSSQARTQSSRWRLQARLRKRRLLCQPQG